MKDKILYILKITRSNPISVEDISKRLNNVNLEEAKEGLNELCE